MVVVGDVVCICRGQQEELEDRLKALEATLDAQENAVLALTYIAASFDREVAEALPSALRMWASKMKDEGREMSAFATEELANRMVRLIKAGRRDRPTRVEERPGRPTG